MDTQSKVYSIAELFNDDLSKVATAIKMTIIPESHKTTAHRLHQNDLGKLTTKIDILYLLLQDSYCIDGFVFFVEAVHNTTEHGSDKIQHNIDKRDIVGDDENQGQLIMFGDEE